MTLNLPIMTEYQGFGWGDVQEAYLNPKDPH
jgi:hypothetical protein